MSASSYASYFQRYEDASLDPFKGAYRNVLETFVARTTRESAAVSSKLMSRVLATTEIQPHAYLLLHAPQGDEPFVTMVHRPFTITPLLGDTQIEEAYCFLGDVSEMIPPQVAFFPSDAFEACGNVRVPMEEVLDSAITEEDPICGPYEEGVAGTEVVATRRMMYLPHRFVTLAMAHSRMTPYEAWNLIGGAIRSDADDTETASSIEDYRVLLDWLRVACTYATAGVLATAYTESLTFPVLDVNLRNKIKQVLRADVPAYGTQSPTNEAATVTAINALTTRIVEANDAAAQREQQAKEKTPYDYYGEGLVILLRICHVATSAELPRLWHRIAQSTKRNERILIEETFRSVADTLNLLPFVPQVSPAFAKKLVTLAFSHYDVDDLEEGIHPFLATFKDQRARAEAQRVSNLYDDVMMGAGAQLADLAALRAAEKVGIPLDLISVGYTYQGFRIILHSMLGATHMLTQAYDRFLSAFLREEHFIATVLPSMATPGQLVRHTQIRLSNWFTMQVQQPERVPVPDLADMLTKIRHQEAWAPRMPAAYDFRTPLSSNQVRFAPPAPVPPTGPYMATPSAVGPPVAPSAQLPAATTGVGRGTRINNPAYHTDFATFKTLGLPLKQVRDKAIAANKPIPKNSKGTEHCLSYHVNGFCWDNCSRKEDHRTHTSQERKALVEWCKLCYRPDGPA
jgi:hypothetical protein